MATPYQSPTSPSYWDPKQLQGLYGAKPPMGAPAPTAPAPNSTLAPAGTFWGSTATGTPTPTLGTGGGGELPGWMQKAADSFEEQRKAQLKALNLQSAAEAQKLGIGAPTSIYAGSPKQAAAFINKLNNSGMPTNYYS